MKEEKPLFKECNESFERGFNHKIQNKDEDIDLGYAFRKIPPYPGYRHEEKINKGSNKPRFVFNGIEVGRLINSVGKEADNREKENKEYLTYKVKSETAKSINN